ncbi:hypothetical protein HK099_005529 [Clydaea vesicula]|uniref:WAPL domain-containing protein n=1 Tax=Clydaea vesicula TaxID=447962 RepID=A0AAD5TZB1_9FUNG|nr:hypothetical protein HK099_005529 [Clydaea vesicula]
MKRKTYGKSVKPTLKSFDTTRLAPPKEFLVFNSDEESTDLQVSKNRVKMKVKENSPSKRKSDGGKQPQSSPKRLKDNGSNFVPDNFNEKVENFFLTSPTTRKEISSNSYFDFEDDLAPPKKSCSLTSIDMKKHSKVSKMLKGSKPLDEILVTKKSVEVTLISNLIPEINNSASIPYQHQSFKSLEVVNKSAPHSFTSININPSSHSFRQATYSSSFQKDDDNELESPLEFKLSQESYGSQETYAAFAKRNKKEGLESSDEEKVEIKTIHEIREGGELKIFSDEVDYIFDGLDAQQAINIRRTSSLDLLKKMLKPAFLIKLRAHNFLVRIFLLLSHTNENEEPDSILVVIILLMMISLLNDSASFDHIRCELANWMEKLIEHSFSNNFQDPLINFERNGKFTKLEKRVLKELSNVIATVPQFADNSLIFQNQPSLILSLKVLASFLDYHNENVHIHSSILNNLFNFSENSLVVKYDGFSQQKWLKNCHIDNAMLIIVKKLSEKVHNVLQNWENQLNFNAELAVDLGELNDCFKVLGDLTLFSDDTTFLFASSEETNWWLESVADLVYYCYGISKLNDSCAKEATVTFEYGLRVLMNCTSIMNIECHPNKSFKKLIFSNNNRILKLLLKNIVSNDFFGASSNDQQLEVENVNEIPETLEMNSSRKSYLLCLGIVINVLESYPPKYALCKCVINDCNCPNKENITNLLIKNFKKMKTETVKNDHSVNSAYMAILLSSIINHSDKTYDSIVKDDKLILTVIKTLEEFVAVGELVLESNLERDLNSNVDGNKDQLLVKETAENNNYRTLRTCNEIKRIIACLQELLRPGE